MQFSQREFWCSSEHLRHCTGEARQKGGTEPQGLWHYTCIKYRAVIVLRGYLLFWHSSSGIFSFIKSDQNIEKLLAKENRKTNTCINVTIPSSILPDPVKITHHDPSGAACIGVRYGYLTQKDHGAKDNDLIDRLIKDPGASEAHSQPL